MQISAHRTCEWRETSSASMPFTKQLSLLYLLCIVYSYGSVYMCVCLQSSRSSSYPFSDSPLYTQTPPASSSTYYEATPSSESDIGGSVTSQPVSVATTGASSGGAPAVGGAGYVIQGSYTLGGGGAGGGGGGQSYSGPNSRAPPATVSAQVQSLKIYDVLKPQQRENRIVPASLNPQTPAGAVAVRKL